MGWSTLIRVVWRWCPELSSLRWARQNSVEDTFLTTRFRKLPFVFDVGAAVEGSTSPPEFLAMERVRFGEYHGSTLAEEDNDSVLLAGRCGEDWVDITYCRPHSSKDGTG